ncbi:MAG: flagellar basal body P-ring protein FlgI [Sedimentisphaerales bacterium]|nr:flagellar basal body P-ring protein FlgI [Sedimentisphaerales bacterium]
MRHIIFIILLISISYGCSPTSHTPSAELEKGTPKDNTVGSVTELTGFLALRVDGFGVVINLSGTGSRDCPPAQREFIVKYLRGMKSRRELNKPYDLMTAEQILDSTSTAVVQISGLVPAGAPKGAAFDVEVRSLPQTQTTSLQGGVLLPCDLRILVAGSRGVLAGQRGAIATGEVFINPFPTSSRQARKGDPRRGVVIGGGRTLYDRKLELALLQPDSRVASLLQRRINTRFQRPGRDKVADASRNVVKITIPEEYRDNYRHFVDVLMAINLDEHPGRQDLRLRELSRLAQQEGADYEAIALAWEAIGKDTLGYLEPIYKSDKGRAAFYAARTALNLEDLTALDTMVAIALNDNHPDQLQAARVLGRFCGDPKAIRARSALATLLNQPNDRLRIIAYEGLRGAADRRIRSYRLPNGMLVEQADSQAGNLLCVWAMNPYRLVLLGRDWRCPNNVFYEGENGLLINAGPDAAEFAITQPLAEGRPVRRTCPLNVEHLVATLAMPPGDVKEKIFLRGLSFSQIVGILYDLSVTEKVIPAVFYLHRTEDDLVN